MLRCCRFLLLLLIVFGAGEALAADGGWAIARNTIVLSIQEDGSLLVDETIYADFQQRKRGIIRTIPVRYSVGMHQYSLRFDRLEVTDGGGLERKKQVKGEGNAVRIRIGDPNVFLRGPNVYRIRYRVRRAVLWEDDRAVLRWNAVGHEWGVPTRAATVRIEPPSGLAADDVWHDAWTGSWNARGKDFTAMPATGGSIVYEVGALRSREGVTVEVSLPESAVPRPGRAATAGWWLLDNFVYVIWPVVLIVCFMAWIRRGRDAPGFGSIAVQYDAPDGMGPAEVGTLIDEKVNRCDISAAIIDLAVRGFLRIEQKPGVSSGATDEYTFHKLETGAEMRPYEESILRSLFPGDNESVRLDDLTTFHLALPAIRKSLYKELTGGGYFDGNPEEVRNRFSFRGGTIVVHLYLAAALVQFLIYGRVFLLSLLVSWLLSLVTVLLMGRLMPRKTGKGRRAWESIAGLEEYVRRAEVDQIASLEKRGVFERLLPYAMVFGLAGRWAKAFEGIYDEAPEWYRGAGSEPSSTVWITDSIGRSTRAMDSNLFADPRSAGGGSGGSGGWSSGGLSGGGFSGGGFGGGGGSSW